MYKRRKNFNFVNWCVMCRCCGGLWVICYFIMRRLIGCGALFLDCLGCRRSYHEWFQISSLVGGLGWGSTCQAFGI